jgi:hypothetical protein
LKHEGRRQTDRRAAYAGSRLKLIDASGRSRLTRQPFSRNGENSPYGMLGGIEETSASFEARSAPRSYPTGLRHGLGGQEVAPCAVLNIVHTAALHHFSGPESGVGLVSRVTPVQTAMRNCTRDEGRSFEVGNQVLISNHRKLLCPKGTVVNVAGKPEQDFGRHD